jgi:hypothetical protein
MKCTGQELFNALTQREMIQIFTGTYQPTVPEVSRSEKKGIPVYWFSGYLGEAWVGIVLIPTGSDFIF